MNIFASMKMYAEKFQEKAKRGFTPEEINAVEKAEVCESQYGLSVCFFMKAGGMAFIPLDINSTAAPGDVVDMTTAELVTIGRSGEDDKQRVRI